MRGFRLAQFTRDAVGVSADLVALGGLAAIATPTVVGILANSLVAALVAALAIASLVILGCIYRIRRLVLQRASLRRRCVVLRTTTIGMETRGVAGEAIVRALFRELGVRDAALDEFRNRVLAVVDGESNLAPQPVAATDRPVIKSSPWLADGIDPTSFTLAASDFESCLERAAAIVRGDAQRTERPWFEMVTVALGDRSLSARDAITITFWAKDPASNTLTVVRVLGAPQEHESATRDAGQVDGKAWMPWREDPCWNDLTQAVLRKLRGAPGFLVLRAISRGEIANESLWIVSFLDLRLQTVRIFSWSGAGRLVEHPTAG